MTTLDQRSPSDPFGGQRRFESLLITEDERVIRQVQRVLEPGGYGVTVHHAGRAGLDALRGGHFLICLVDQDLMDISGFEVVGQGKDLSPETEFVMLFEYPSMSKALLALTYGAYGYLPKPVEDPAALLTKVILAREKISLNMQLRTLMQEFEDRGRVETDLEGSSSSPAWATGVATDMGNT